MSDTIKLELNKSTPNADLQQTIDSAPSQDNAAAVLSHDSDNQVIADSASAAELVLDDGSVMNQPVQQPQDVKTINESNDSQPELSVKYLEDVNLTPEEQQEVDSFSEKINIADTNIVLI